MKRLTLFLTACLVAVLAVFVTNTRAQSPDTNQRTFMTFNTAVELPGVTLEPGTYEFRLAPMNESRNVVQVLKKDDSKVMGQWTFVPAQRERAADDTIVMFKEAPEGTTPAVQYWYYPGQTIGKEFIYPKDQAEKIAARTGQNVRSDDGQINARASAGSATPSSASTAADNQSAQNGASDRVNANAASASANSDASLGNAAVPAQPSAPAGSLTGNRGIPQADASAATSTDKAPSANASADASLQNAPVPAQPSAPAGSLTGNRGVVGTSGSADAAATTSQQADRPVGTSGVAQAPAPQTPPAPAAQANPRPTTSGELPKTASPLPLSALIGVLSLVAAVGLRSLRA